MNDLVKKAFRDFLILLVLSLFGLWFIISVLMSMRVDLEIYTPRDIYFIHGRHITSETGQIDTTLQNYMELREYLSNLTASDVLEN